MGLLKWIAPAGKSFREISLVSQKEIETDEKLRQSEERYRGVVESQKDLVIRISPAGKFTFVNDAYCRKLQKSREDLIGSSFDPFVHPDDLQTVTNFVASLSKPPFRGYLEHRSWFHGGWRLTLWEGYAIRDAAGNIIEYQGVGRDITDQRAVELALRESEEKFRAAFENSPIAQGMTGMDGRFLKVNATLCELLGYTQEELVKKTFFDVTHEADKLLGAEALKNIKSGKINMMRFEKRYLHKSGRVIHAILVTSAVLDERNAPMYLVSQIIDISDRIQNELIQKKHAEELTRSNTELAQFAYVVSHDIREPLRMITNFIELLVDRSGKALDQVSQEYAHFALDGARRAQELIHDLLTFAQVEQNDESETPVDLNEVLTQVTLSLTPQIEETSAKIIYTPFTKAVRGSESRFIQIFQNLITNALKYHGSEPPLVEIQSKERATDWLFSVEDNGIGIETQFRERVFQIFQRLHPRGTYSGTGMGLAIVKKIIESRGGKIWIEDSVKTSGIKIIFTWPKSRSTFFKMMSAFKEAKAKSRSES